MRLLFAPSFCLIGIAVYRALCEASPVTRPSAELDLEQLGSKDLSTEEETRYINVGATARRLEPEAQARLTYEQIRRKHIPEESARAIMYGRFAGDHKRQRSAPHASTLSLLPSEAQMMPQHLADKGPGVQIPAHSAGSMTQADRVSGDHGQQESDKESSDEEFEPRKQGRSSEDEVQDVAIEDY